MKKYLILLLFCSMVYGQDFGISGMLGFPQGEFKANIDRLGYGVNGQFNTGTLLGDLPFDLGINLGYLVYGEDTRETRLSPLIPAFVDVTTTNSIFNFHMLFQIDPLQGPVRPYVEGLFGGAYISTRTSVDSDWDDEEITSSTNFDDFSWSYGAGGGIMILVHEEPDEANIYLNLRVRYMFASEAEYLKEGSIEVIGNDLYYDVYKSNMDLLTLHIGVVASIP